jgi:hypothetical protein
VLIVAISYDSETLNSRLGALERMGNIVVPASSLESGMSAIFNSFHLLIIGATVPYEDRKQLAAESKRLNQRAEIISVEWPGSRRLDSADICVAAGSEQRLIEAVKRIQYK